MLVFLDYKVLQKFLILPKQIIVFFLFSALFSSCSKQAEENSFENSEDEILASLDLKSDSFSLSSTYQRQLEVFNSLFINEGSPYAIPGNRSLDEKEKLFEKIRAGYFTESVMQDQEIQKFYHNFAHAMDVMITTHCLLKTGGSIFLTQDEQSLLILAALAHDARHTGLMNSFLINSNHEYSQKYEHDSLQEKLSLIFLLELMEQNQIIDSSKNSKAKRFLSEVIIFTDMKKHKEQLQKINNIIPKVLAELKSARGEKESNLTLGASHMDIEKNIDLSSKLDEGARFLIASFILHCADISNPGKDWEQSERWAVLVLNEFFQQGDFEKQREMEVSMNCDREKTSIPESQLGFGQYIIKELYDLLARLNHEAGSQFQENFETNQLIWKRLREEEKLSGNPYLPVYRPPSIQAGWNGKE